MRDSCTAFIMKIMPIFLVVLMLSGCSQSEKKVVHHEQLQPSTDESSPKQSVRTTERSHPVTKATNKENEQYKQVVTTYTANMNEVINSMTTTMDVQTAKQQYNKTKKYITQYEEQKVKTTPTPELKEVDQTIGEANAKYLGAMDQIVKGIEEQDAEKQQQGFRSFSEAHQYFNTASFTIAADIVSSSETPSTELPSTEQAVEKEVYSSETTEEISTP